ncbi:alpha/beta hydrolase [Synechococcus sp. A15-127]|uniref:alpha/beta fold hydrolase n=1 Tax=Synechococcus sp. A15-127 TaxID=1050624 RepID=UPI001860A037|nr:alpha/beta fold hydrolase [Synechococcus sp. A15-127]QNI95133.1 alpha/beta hydrolase [Synechococcus sp. A15-127]
MNDRAVNVIDDPQLLLQLGVSVYRQRWPWLGGDLQTLRDTLRPAAFPVDGGEPVQIPVPPLASGAADAGELLAYLDRPLRTGEGGSATHPAIAPKALVVVLHGLGGSSRRQGLRRLTLSLQGAGFAVLRLNLRGADPGRHLAGGTYAAACNSDLLPVLERARHLAAALALEAGLSKPVPLLGAGISLGGTMLLNACLDQAGALDALFCASSPLDLAACSASIERPRNRVYQRWLLQRLVRQTLADPFGVRASEERQLCGNPPRSIRAFDAAVTAPRWGFSSVDEYYLSASPLHRLAKSPQGLPPTLLLQALDDPWVPAASARQLQSSLAKRSAQGSQTPVEILLTARGGHNGFHGHGDNLSLGCWSDRLALAWFNRSIQSAVCRN